MKISRRLKQYAQEAAKDPNVQKWVIKSIFEGSSIKYTDIFEREAANLSPKMTKIIYGEFCSGKINCKCYDCSELESSIGLYHSSEAIKYFAEQVLKQILRK